MEILVLPMPVTTTTTVLLPPPLLLPPLPPPLPLLLLPLHRLPLPLLPQLLLPVRLKVKSALVTFRTLLLLTPLKSRRVLSKTVKPFRKLVKFPL